MNFVGTQTFKPQQVAMMEGNSRQMPRAQERVERFPWAWGNRAPLPSTHLLLAHQRFPKATPCHLLLAIKRPGLNPSPCQVHSPKTDSCRLCLEASRSNKTLRNAESSRLVSLACAHAQPVSKPHVRLCTKSHLPTSSPRVRLHPHSGCLLQLCDSCFQES